MTSLEQFGKQIRENSKSMEDFSKLSKALGGTLSNLETDFEDALQDLFDLDEELKSNTENLYDGETAWQKFSNAIEGYTDNIRDATIGSLGLSLNIADLLSQAFQMIQHWSGIADGLRNMSDASGSAAAAVGTLTTAMGRSLAAQGTIQESMTALNDQGLELGKQFTDLTVLTADLDQMTGVAASSWANFTGKLAFDFGATTEELTHLSSALIASGLKGQQLTTVMEAVSKSIEGIAYMAGNSMDMVKALTKTISSATGVFQKLGINAQVATEFINKMLNPEEFQNNVQLYARLGISAEDYFRALESGNAQVELMNTMMGNLPKLADQLSSIRNPFQRFNLAKQLGLPMEMVSKMAGKTREEIEELMKVQMEKAQEDEALKKKREAAKASMQKFDEMMEMLRMQALAPIMGLVSKHMPMFIKILTRISQIANKLFESLSPAIDTILTGLETVAVWILDIVGALANTIKSGNIDSFITMVSAKLAELVSWFASNIVPIIIKGFKIAISTIAELVKKNPLFMSLVGAGAGFALFKKFFSKERGDSAAKPLWVRTVGGIQAANRGLGRALDFLKNPGAVIGQSLRNFGATLRAVGARSGVGAISSLGRTAATAARFIPAIGGAASAAGGAGGVAASLGSLAAAAAPVAAVIGSLVGGFVALRDSAKHFGVEQSKLTQQQKEASAAAGVLTLGLAPLIDSLFDTDITGWLARAIDGFMSFMDSLGAFGEVLMLPMWVIRVIIKLMVGMSDWFTKNADIISAWWFIVKLRIKTFIETVAYYFNKVFGGIQKGASDVVENVIAFFNKAKSFIVGIIDGIAGFFNSAWDMAKGALLKINSVLGGILEPLFGILRKAKEALGALWNTISEFFKRLFFMDSEASAKAIAMAKGKTQTEMATIVAEIGNKQGNWKNFSDEERMQAQQDLIEFMREKQKEDQERAEREAKDREEANKLAAQTAGSIGGIADDVSEIRDQGRKKPEAPKVSLQVFNRMAVQQFRYM